MEGLGINFDPPQSPEAPAPNPLVTRLQRGGSGHLASVLKRPLPERPRAPESLPSTTSSGSQRRARIDESTPVVLGDNSYEEEQYREYDGDSSTEMDYGEVEVSPEPRYAPQKVQDDSLSRSASIHNMRHVQSLNQLSSIVRSAELRQHSRCISQQDFPSRYSGATAMQSRSQSHQGVSTSKSYNDLNYFPEETVVVESRPARMRSQTLSRPVSMMELSEISNLHARQRSNSVTIEAHQPDLMHPHEASPAASSQATASSYTSAAEMAAARIHNAQKRSVSMSASNPVLRPAEEIPIPGSVIGEPTIVSATTGPLQRQSTLLSAGANPIKRQRELNRLLAPSNSKKTLAEASETRAPSSAASSSAVSSAGISEQGLTRKASTVILEQAKTKARVELDVVLDSNLVVEGGLLKGKMEVRVRPKDGEVWIGCPKARIVGFEELTSGARHIFYHHAVVVDSTDDATEKQKTLPCFSSDPDEEGFFKGTSGTHSFPFSMRLPVGKGAKGCLKSKQGVVKYIVIGSMKLKNKDGSAPSIAHFYRDVEVFPYLNPALTLASALKPITSTSSKAMFLGGSGKVDISASVHRPTWVAGQRCYIDISVKNGTTKRIKSLAISVVRTTTVFRAQGEAKEQSGDPQTNTTRKKVAETVLEVGKKGAKGDVTAKGMWLGVDKDEESSFSHSIHIPADALTITRGQYIEVSYVLRIAASASLSTDISVDLPIRVINFVSLDPPPGHLAPELASPIISPSPRQQQSRKLARSWSIDELRAPKASTSALKQAHALTDRAISMDSLQLSDLNRIYDQSYGMRRTESEHTVPLGLTGTADMARTLSMASHQHEPHPVVVQAQERQLKHQMSLDCIGSAIASATSRRVGHHRSMSGLRQEISEEPTMQRIPEDEQYEDSDQHHGMQQLAAVQLDDLDDIPDDFEEQPRQDAFLLDEDSEDEIDCVLESAASQGMQRLPSGSSISSVPQHRVVVVQPSTASPVRARATSVSQLRSPKSPSARCVPHSPSARSPGIRQTGLPTKKSFDIASAASPVRARLTVTNPSAPSPPAPRVLKSAMRQQPSLPNLRKQSSIDTFTLSHPPRAHVRARSIASSHHEAELLSPPELSHNESDYSSSGSPSSAVFTPPGSANLHSPDVYNQASEQNYSHYYPQQPVQKLNISTMANLSPSSVKSRIAALENAPRVPTRNRGLRTSVSSDLSSFRVDTNELLGRQNSMMSYKAPIWRGN